MQKKRRMNIWIICAMIVGFLFPQTAYAINPLDVGADVRLTVNCHPDADTAFPD